MQRTVLKARRLKCMYCGRRCQKRTTGTARTRACSLLGCGLATLGMMLVPMAGCEPQSANTGSPKPAETKPSTAQKAADLVGSMQSPKTERVKAEVGVGKEGQRLENPDLVQPIVAPARALFRTKQRVVFEIQIPHALQLYKALKGKAPETQDEFMQQIVKANKIQLPKLPEGHRYVYDPEKEELMVERPAK